MLALLKSKRALSESAKILIYFALFIAVAYTIFFSPLATFINNTFGTSGVVGNFIVAFIFAVIVVYSWKKVVKKPI